jgi:hypothetical protein
MLVGKSYDNIVSLFWLAVSAEKEILWKKSIFDHPTIVQDWF